MVILITAGSGFLGSHIVKYIIENTNYNVISIDRFHNTGNLNRLAWVNNGYAHRFKQIYHDLRSPINESVRKQIGYANIILNIAAMSHVTSSIRNPVEFIENNVMSTTHLLEFLRRISSELFIQFSTDEVVGSSPRLDLFFKDQARTNPLNPYAASKAAAEDICVAYQNTYDLPIVITRTNNIYGETQNSEKFIPLIIKRILNSQKVVCHWDSETRKIGSRSYLYAQDVARALISIINYRDEFPINDDTGIKIPRFNITSRDIFRNDEIIELIFKSMDKKIEYSFEDANKSRPGHDFDYRMDGALFRDTTGWTQKYSLLDTLPQIVQFYRSNPEWL